MSIFYTGTLTVLGETSKSEVLALAQMLGMDLNNFCIEEVSGPKSGPTLSYPFPFNGFKSVTINHLYKKTEEFIQSENPPKKKRGRPRKIRTEEETEATRKGKSRKSSAVSGKNDRDSSPDIFYHVTNPTFNIKAGEKKTKKKTRKRKANHDQDQLAAQVIPDISLTFDLGGEIDRTINLNQLADNRPAKRGRKKKSESQEDFVTSKTDTVRAGVERREEDSDNYLTFASPEEALESIEREEAALEYSSDDENALIMDLSQSGGAV